MGGGGVGWGGRQTDWQAERQSERDRSNKDKTPFVFITSVSLSNCISGIKTPVNANGYRE